MSKLEIRQLSCTIRLLINLNNDSKYGFLDLRLLGYFDEKGDFVRKSENQPYIISIDRYLPNDSGLGTLTTFDNIEDETKNQESLKISRLLDSGNLRDTISAVYILSYGRIIDGVHIKKCIEYLYPRSIPVFKDTSL